MITNTLPATPPPWTRPMSTPPGTPPSNPNSPLPPRTFTTLSSPPQEPKRHYTPYEGDLRDSHSRIYKSWNDTQATLNHLSSLLYDTGPDDSCSLAYFLGIRGSISLSEFQDEAEVGHEILADIAEVESGISELKRERDRVLTHLNVLTSGKEWEEYCKAMERMEEMEEGGRYGGFGGLEVVMEDPQGSAEEEDVKTDEEEADGGSGSDNGERCPGDEWALDLETTLWYMAHQLKADSAAAWDQDAASSASVQQEEEEGKKEPQEEKEGKEEDNTWEGFLRAEAIPVEIAERSPWEMHEELREILAFEMEYEFLRDAGFEWEY